MKMLNFRTLCTGLIFISSSAVANTYVICGQAVNSDTFTVTGYEMELSSEGEDNYSGPVGKNWNMKLGSQDAEWLAPNLNIVAKNYKSGADTIIEIRLISGESISGPVGIQYKLIDLYDDEPVLEKYTMGGTAGSIKIGTFQCLSGND